MDDARYDVLITQIEAQLPELYLAELIQVADFVRRLKASRNFTTSAKFDK